MVSLIPPGYSNPQEGSEIVDHDIADLPASSRLACIQMLMHKQHQYANLPSSLQGPQRRYLIAGPGPHVTCDVKRWGSCGNPRIVLHPNYGIRPLEIHPYCACVPTS